MSNAPRFRDLRSRTRFSFVRHGESEANRLDLIQGHTNSPLSDLGREHARAAGRWLAGADVEVVFSSPLDRGLETARIIASEVSAADPIVIEELKELDTGIYSGENLREREKEDYERYSQFRVYSWDAVPGAESRDSLLSRALRVWERLVTEANAGRRHIVCVSHGGMLQWMIKATISAADHRWMPVFGMANCGISTLYAQSTSLDVDGELPPDTGYYANWDQINYVPY